MPRTQNTQQDRTLTFALHSRSEHADSTGVDGRLHCEAGGEVGYILPPVADGEGVGAGVQGDVGDGVGSVSIILDVDLCLCPAVTDDLYGQLSWTCVGTVHHKLPIISHLGTLQPLAIKLQLKWGGGGHRKYLIVL